MTKPKKTPRKEGGGRKQLPYHLKKTAIPIHLRNEQWDEVFEETTREQVSDAFWQWFKQAKALANQFETVNTQD